MYRFWAVQVINCTVFQAEATLLKSLTSGGTTTKVVALGIGNAVDESELQGMASSPPEKNVILVQDYNDLSDVEEQLRNESCTRNVSLKCLIKLMLVWRKMAVQVNDLSLKQCIKLTSVNWQALKVFSIVVLHFILGRIGRILSLIHISEPTRPY